MKKIFSIIMAVVALGFVACVDDHQEPVDLSLKIGNVYCTDGSIYPVDYFKNQGLEAAGIVTKVGGKEDAFRALVISLEDIGSHQYMTSLEAEASSISSALDAMDGKENTSALVYASIEDSLVVPTAALECVAYRASGKEAWHLPSVAEFRTVTDNYWTIERSLREVGGESLGHLYQTSTVDGTSSSNEKLYNYLIELPKGNVSGTLKTDAHPVRPFLILK